MMLWCLWRRRNDKVWDGETKDERLVVQLARELLSQWCTVRDKNEQQQQPLPCIQQEWQPPEPDYIKCNVDAALFRQERAFGIGMCLRNSQGHFIKALTKWYNGIPPAQEAEATGLRDANLWLGHLGLSKVHIELDCKLVVDGIVDSSNNQSEFGNIMANCRALLQHFPNFKISFVRRQANYVAHSLARESQLHTRHQVFDLIPPCITTILMNEIR